MNRIVKIVVAVILFILIFKIAATAQTAAEMYNYGFKAAENEEYHKALDWWHQAAKAGNVDAMHGLGLLYSSRRDYAIALQWYTKAADKGHIVAMRDLGHLYKLGQGDNAKAREWYNKAADNGDEAAMYFLGELYEYGEGVTKDLSKAREWYAKADEKGYGHAKGKLAEIDKLLSSASSSSSTASATTTPIEINAPTSTQQAARGSQTISVGKSDVAENIPVTNIKNDKTFAVIIANENYLFESKVEFAQNDGETFMKYCLQTLGLPERNIRFYPDATLNVIRSAIGWISRTAEDFAPHANIIFYYAGHGIPDPSENSGTSYLLPADGFGNDIESGYKLDDLYARLGALPAQGITVFLDACFSGAQRTGDMMVSARGTAIKATPGEPKGNMVVFSAAQSDETAFPMRDKQHGMFTYFLLKKLQETKGDVTLGELGDYIGTNVRQQSNLVNNKRQTPVVTPAPAMHDKWKGMKLRN